jgi:hypothetical protein
MSYFKIEIDPDRLTSSEAIDELEKLVYVKTFVEISQDEFVGEGI